MFKSFKREDMMKCIPIMWSELTKIKTRVEDVFNTLNNKMVKNEKAVEFKK